MLAEIMTDFPERFENLGSVLVENPGGEPGVLTAEETWFHKGRVVIKFAGVDSIDAAERLRGCHLLIPAAERRRLRAGSYYFWELVGCRVLAGHDEKEVGEVTEVEPSGAGALLHVRGAKGEILVPFVEEICARIDLAARTILIHPPEGLLELNEA